MFMPVPQPNLYAKIESSRDGVTYRGNEEINIAARPRSFIAVQSHSFLIFDTSILWNSLNSVLSRIYLKKFTFVLTNLIFLLVKKYVCILLWSA